MRYENKLKSRITILAAKWQETEASVDEEMEFLELLVFYPGLAGAIDDMDRVLVEMKKDRFFSLANAITEKEASDAQKAEHGFLLLNHPEWKESHRESVIASRAISAALEMPPVESSEEDIAEVHGLLMSKIWGKEPKFRTQGWGHWMAKSESGDIWQLLNIHHQKKGVLLQWGSTGPEGSRIRSRALAFDSDEAAGDYAKTRFAEKRKSGFVRIPELAARTEDFQRDTLPGWINDYLKANASFDSPLMAVEYSNPIDDGIIDELKTGTRHKLTRKKIRDLSPLSKLHGVKSFTKLALEGNRITDLAPLAGLTTLTELTLRDNEVALLAPLEGLTGLKSLLLGKNEIISVIPLSELVSLEVLMLGENMIFDVSPLRALTTLKRLGLRKNDIEDLKPLAELKLIEWLHLEGNKITDIAPLAGLELLKTLKIQSNPLTDLSPLSNMHLLERLFLTLTSDMDLAPLSKLKSLRELWVHTAEPFDPERFAAVQHLERITICASPGSLDPDSLKWFHENRQNRPTEFIVTEGDEQNLGKALERSAPQNIRLQSQSAIRNLSDVAVLISTGE